MKHLLVVFLVIGVATSCEPTLDDGVDLIGEWFLIAGCDTCTLFEFEKDGILEVSDIYDESPTIYYYNLLRNNKIEIDGTDVNGTYEIITHSNDTIEIIDFSLSGFPEDKNTRLKRK